MHRLTHLFSSRVFGQASNNYNALSSSHNLSQRQVRQVYTAYAQAAAKLEEVSYTVDKHEAELGIEVRWIPGSSEYNAILVELYLRDYRHALDRLEYLVVQRMFELSKLGMSGVGQSCYSPPNPLSLMVPRVQDAPEDWQRPSGSIRSHKESPQGIQPTCGEPPSPS